MYIRIQKALVINMIDMLSQHGRYVGCSNRPDACMYTSYYVYLQYRYR